jgi:hypothetical protein
MRIFEVFGYKNPPHCITAALQHRRTQLDFFIWLEKGRGKKENPALFKTSPLLLISGRDPAI